MLRTIIFIALFLAVCNAACTNPLANAAVPPGFCASLWFGGLNAPRGIITVANGDVIVLERGAGQVSVIYRNAAGNLQKSVLANANGLNHAVIVHGGYLYASSIATVYRWPYTVGTRTNLGAPQTVIYNIPTGGHDTRSLIFDPNGLLLVQIGSDANVDSTPARSGIRQFDLSTGIPQTFISGAWYVNGLRNEVGLRADAKGNVWGVENGMDNLNRPDFGGDIHLGNPSEEVNMFTAGKFFGYPYCWSQYNLPVVTTPRGTQYGLAPFLTDGIHTDKWCQNTTNVTPPAYNLHPHTAPLDLFFYYGSSFPSYAGDLFVAQHGSWNSQPPVGYRVTRVKFQNGVPVSDDPFLWYSGSGQNGPGWHRPVALTLIQQNGNDVLLVTSDSSGVILAVQYSP